MDVSLDGDITAAGIIGVFTADEGRRCTLGPLRIFRAVDEAGQVPRVEVSESVDFFGEFSDARELPSHPYGQFDVEIMAV